MVCSKSKWNLKKELRAWRAGSKFVVLSADRKKAADRFFETKTDAATIAIKENTKFWEIDGIWQKGESEVFLLFSKTDKSFDFRTLIFAEEKVGTVDSFTAPEIRKIQIQIDNDMIYDALSDLISDRCPLCDSKLIGKSVIGRDQHDQEVDASYSHCSGEGCQYIED